MSATIISLFRKASTAVVDALFPENVACALCNRETFVGPDGICGNCRATLKRCPPLKANGALDGLSAAFLYDGSVKHGIRRLKYDNRRYIARFFADAMEIPGDWSPDCIAPVPLHPKKQWKRSYNQSELIAKFLSARCGVPLRTDLLVRTKNTRSQTRLGMTERRSNMIGAFSANPSAAGRTILLIDDVTTTHSTLLACADALKRGGSVRVYALCACAASFERKQVFNPKESAPYLFVPRR